MVEGGEAPTPHLFQIQMQLIWEEAGDAQSLLPSECAASPLPAAAWWGREGGEKGRGSAAGKLCWPGEGTALVGTCAAFAHLGLESDLDHSLNYLFWIIR